MKIYVNHYISSPLPFAIIIFKTFVLWTVSVVTYILGAAVLHLNYTIANWVIGSGSIIFRIFIVIQ